MMQFKGDDWPSELKRFLIVLILLVVASTNFPAVAHCGTGWYAPTFLKSDKEAVEVLNSLKGSFFGSHLYPKQTIEIDKYGLRLFSEYIGTEKKWASFWSYDIVTVPVLKSEKSGIAFATIQDISINFIQVESLGQNYQKWAVIVDPPAPGVDPTGNIFVVADSTMGTRFANAVATLAVASGTKWTTSGGGIGALKETWFRKNLNWNKETGAVLKEVSVGSPFHTAGIMGNDILLTFNSKDVKNVADLSVYEAELNNSDSFEIKIPVTLFRAGTILSKEVTYFNYNIKARQVQKLLGQDATATPQAPIPTKPKFGASVRSLTEDDIKTFKLASNAGTLVTEIQNDGLAQKMKLLPNDIIVEANGIVVKDSNHLQEILAGSTVSKLKVIRGETVMELVATVSL